MDRKRLEQGLAHCECCVFAVIISMLASLLPVVEGTDGSREMLLPPGEGCVPGILSRRGGSYPALTSASSPTLTFCCISRCFSFIAGAQLGREDGGVLTFPEGQWPAPGQPVRSAGARTLSGQYSSGPSFC